MKKILKCKFTCDECKLERENVTLPNGWLGTTSKITGFEFNLCRDCVESLYRNLADTICDFPQ